MLRETKTVDGPTDQELQATTEAIQRGGDPLGDRLAVVRFALDHRPIGQFLTPPEIVGPMVEWALGRPPHDFGDYELTTPRLMSGMFRRC